jgi:D-arabinose 1-dehydrogenase-like Zn-dependent alcohol dehydrogenase
MKSEALWYLGDRKLELRPIELPEPGYDEVVVETEACGICTWDIMAYLGRMAENADAFLRGTTARTRP